MSHVPRETRGAPSGQFEYVLALALGDPREDGDASSRPQTRLAITASGFA